MMSKGSISTYVRAISTLIYVDEFWRAGTKKARACVCMVEDRIDLRRYTFGFYIAIINTGTCSGHNILLSTSI